MKDTDPNQPGAAHVDLRPSARVLSDLVVNVPDGALAGPTPCPDYTVGDLIDHIGGLAVAFTAAARQEIPAGGTTAPSVDGGRLERGFRRRIVGDLAVLGDAWCDPRAWTGMTQVGGVDLPGEAAGLVALDEIVVHGWDLARATGQPFSPDDATLDALHGFVAQFCGPGSEPQRAGLFGPELPAAPGAPLLERILAMTGRDPAWQPPG